MLEEAGLIEGRNLYDIVNTQVVHHLNQALKANVMFKRDIDYIVKDGQVVIIDEFTGRMMIGRRYSEGLHQALEAKEKVEIQRENQTLASITFQNLFRMYAKLAGMTGTADTEAGEFAKIYNLDVVVAPTNRPNIRKDFPDVVYRTEKEKFNAIVEEIRDCNKRGQPVLVGTISIEKSERLAGYLVRHGIKHNVLNAKQHEKEAEIIAQAGRKGAVTIATNMAGRGTDILLGGNPDFLFKKSLYAETEMPPDRQTALLDQIKTECETEKKEVIALGGLHILGTERHESRRIDNQLRGRAGRQGDPGTSRFYLSLEDDLLRIFGSDRISKIMLKLGMEEGVPIEAGMVTRAIENAQKKVEAHHFEIRKQLLDYDDVMNKQREVVYERRHMILSGEDLSEDVKADAEEVLDGLLDVYCPKDTYSEEWDLKGLTDACYAQFSIDLKDGSIDTKNIGFEALRDELAGKIHAAYAAKEKELGSELLRYLEKMVMLRTIDTLWKDHLLAMDTLREGIGLRGYGQKDPLIEYKREGFDMFAAVMDRFKQDVLEHLFRVQMVQGEQPPVERPRRPASLTLNRGEDTPDNNGDKTIRRSGDKVGRNDPCPCGSGKKYKKCHGA